MHDDLRAGLLLFALLTLLSAVPIVLRRLRPAVLGVVHALGLLVVVALVVAALGGRGDARPLLLPYLVGLVLAALGGPGPAGGRPVGRGLAWAGLGLGLLGVVASAATLLSLALPVVVRLSLVALAGAFGAVAAWRGLARAKAAGNAVERSADHAAVVAIVLASAAVCVALGAPGLPAPWPVALALAAAVTTAVRVPPYVPPTAREGVSALFVGLALLFADTAAEGFVHAVLVGLTGALVTLAVLAASRPLLVSRAGRARQRASPVERPADAPLLAEAAVAYMAPMLDDALSSRPSRPRVNARVTAKRLLEASLERARAAGPPGRRSLPLDVREDDADIDVEGDPGELAEALCAVLDNALGLKQEHPALHVRVHVRGSPSHVTFEVTDDLARQLDDAEPPGPDFTPFKARADESGRSLGIGLARARLLVERHGGVLLARRTPDGSCVQLTVPRRRGRHPYGLA